MDIARQVRPSRAARIPLGILGIAGGLGLLAAFAVDIPPALNTWRLVLFSVGAVAIAVATFPDQAALDRRLAAAGALPLIVASTGSIAWTLLAIGRPSTFSGAFGLVGFWIGMAMWLGHAWFGTVALRIGALPRLAALMLAVGSILALLGMDRLALTSSANPTIVGPLSLAGIALNAAAWVIFGVDVLRQAGDATGGPAERGSGSARRCARSCP